MGTTGSRNGVCDRKPYPVLSPFLPGFSSSLGARFADVFYTSSTVPSPGSLLDTQGLLPHTEGHGGARTALGPWGQRLDRSLSEGLSGDFVHAPPLALCRVLLPTGTNSSRCVMAVEDHPCPRACLSLVRRLRLSLAPTFS